MRLVLGFFLLTLTSPAMALTLKAQINHIDYGVKEEPTLLFLTSGEVVKVDGSDVSAFEDALENDELVELTVDEDMKVNGVATIGMVEEEKTLDQPSVSEDATVLDTNTVSKIFNDLNSGYRKRSQCYNRAHVWTYETKKNYGVNLKKIFIFFTRKYIREYNYHWWFHVSPMALVSEDGSVKEKVLDYRFINTPYDVRKWTDHFMYNDAHCPVVSKYTDYENNQEKESCYLMKTSMYYYQPLDLEALELQGKEKHAWVEWEVNNAYRQGFKR